MMMFHHVKRKIYEKNKIEAKSTVKAISFLKHGFDMAPDLVTPSRFIYLE